MEWTPLRYFYPWWLLQTARVATTSHNSLAPTVKILDVNAIGGIWVGGGERLEIMEGADFKFLPFVTAHRCRVSRSSSGESHSKASVFKTFSKIEEKS
jgi:hypothetical protein